MGRILILGARGMLGSSLCIQLQNVGHDVVRQSRSEGLEAHFNPLDYETFARYLAVLQPDVVINLIAATDVDRCERQPQWAFDANIGPVLSFLQATRRKGIEPHLIHISTDQVYQGQGPHIENKVRPCNVYGLSKLAAELAIIKYPSTIIRTNFFGASRSPGRNSLSDWIVNSLKKETPITLFKDVQFSGLHIDTLCDIINKAIKLRPTGVYNVGTIDGISKAEFALRLGDQLGLRTEGIQITSIVDAGLYARRPLDMRMNTELFRRSFELDAPKMSNQINKTANDYQ